MYTFKLNENVQRQKKNPFALISDDASIDLQTKRTADVNKESDHLRRLLILQR